MSIRCLNLKVGLIMSVYKTLSALCLVPKLKLNGLGF